MSSQTKVKYDFESTWSDLLARVTGEGPTSALETISKESDPKRRNAWLRFLYQGLSMRDWPHKSLAPMLVIGDAAIAFALEEKERAQDEEGRRSWTDEANIHCYNLSANLADCWEDGMSRDEAHFERGLAYADRATEFREQLGKPAPSRAMAAWARGIHLLSLNRISEARSAFSQSLAFEEEALTPRLTPPYELTADTPFGVLLCHGYLALCALAGGEEETRSHFDRVLQLFESQKAKGEDSKADAEIGLLQLRATEKRLSGSH